MKKGIQFVKTTVMGGLLVILPAAIVIAVFRWVYRFATDLIEPLTNIVTARSAMAEFLADLFVIGLIVGFCFLLGLAVRTGVGRFVRDKLDLLLGRFAPGYRITRETVLQFLGKRKSPFSSVALVRIFENSAMATAFITDEHPDGRYTVFVPTGPNPTSGQIFHLEGRFVHPVDVGVDEAMRSILSCGAGSGSILGGTKPLETD